MQIEDAYLSEEYPREDKCKYCGEHLGWVLHPMAEAFALGVCDKPKCQQKAKHEEEQCEQ